jgi:capsular polysaccharide biosynthesis protein
MSFPLRLWLNRFVALCAIGLVAGAVAGALFPVSKIYRATTQVALVPGPNLTTADASAYWEVLTQGQVSRTAAAIFADPRWGASAASVAGVAESNLTLTAGAVPDTTMVSITADAPSAQAAQAAAADLLAKATPEVTAVSAPFQVRVVSPPDGASAMTTSRTQLILAGALGGLMCGAAVGIGVTWLRSRRSNT